MFIHSLVLNSESIQEADNSLPVCGIMGNI